MRDVKCVHTCEKFMRNFLVARKIHASVNRAHTSVPEDEIFTYLTFWVCGLGNEAIACARLVSLTSRDHVIIWIQTQPQMHAWISSVVMKHWINFQLLHSKRGLMNFVVFQAGSDVFSYGLFTLAGVFLAASGKIKTWLIWCFSTENLHTQRGFVSVFTLARTNNAVPCSCEKNTRKCEYTLMTVFLGKSLPQKNRCRKSHFFTLHTVQPAEFEILNRRIPSNCTVFC